MRLRHVSFVSLVFLLAFALTAPEAWARGGRFNAPAARKPAGDPQPTTAPPADDGSDPLQEVRDNCSDIPGQERGAPAAVLPGGGGGGRKVGAAKARGLSDWSYWYDANREEFEDLRKGAHLTESNPLFALGTAAGARVGRVERRLGTPAMARLRGAVQAVVATDDHWVYTEGAAYVALGKIAEDGAQVERIYKALAKASGHNRFVRESAALGLGQLRRTEKRNQLASTTVDRARDVLREVLADSREAPRLRAFAAVSLGLLGDQPSGDARIGATTATQLLRAWTSEDLSDETQVGILVGIGFLRPGDVSTVVRLALTSAAVRGKIGSRSTSAVVASHAALGLARIGTAADAQALVALLESRDGAQMLRQGAVIAAGVLGRRVPAARPALASALIKARAQSKDPAGRNVASIALARLIAADAAQNRDGTLRSSKAAGVLLASVRKGDAQSRSFGALALALAVRGIDERVESEKSQELRASALQALRKGYADRSLDGHGRAAFATAIGLVGDKSSAGLLLAALQDEDRDPELRAYAALGLGLLGDARVTVIRAVADALRDTRSDALRVRATTALGLLGGGKMKDRARTISILIEQLRVTRNQYVKGQIAITLARIGDARAVKPLVEMLEAEGEAHMNRSMACAALGLLGDEERTPVMSEARRDSHYMSGSGVVYDLLDVL